MYDFDDINRILAEMVDDGMAEPCDCDDAHPLDWAEATNLWDEIVDEIYPEPMVDSDGVAWYTH